MISVVKILNEAIAPYYVDTQKLMPPVQQQVQRRVTPNLVQPVVKTVSQTPGVINAANPQSVNPYVQHLRSRVKSGMGTDQGFEDAKRLAAANAAIKAQPAGIPAVPPPAQTIKPNIAKEAIQQDSKPAVIPKVATTEPQELSGIQHAGIALQKGIKAGGEAAGGFAKKAGEFAAENPGTAGVLGGALMALGAKKLLNRNKQ